MSATETCEAISCYFDLRCGEPAIGRYVRACVHEHMHEGPLCQEHVDLVEVGVCKRCFYLPGDAAHECPVAIKPAALAGNGGAS